MKRVFVAIQVNKSQQLKLVQLQNSLDKQVKLVDSHNLHMTIAFFGAVNDKQLQQLITKLSAIVKKSFTVKLDRLAFWHKPKVLCLTGKSYDKSLLQMVNRCQKIAQRLHLQTGNSRYRPHITLARKANKQPATTAKLKVKEIILKPNQIDLLQSASTTNGKLCQVIHSWKLPR